MYGTRKLHGRRRIQCDLPNFVNATPSIRHMFYAFYNLFFLKPLHYTPISSPLLVGRLHHIVVIEYSLGNRHSKYGKPSL